jgi:UDP-glucose 4-epimerase
MLASRSMKKILITGGAGFIGSHLADVQKLIFAGSAAVYGDSPVLPKGESIKPEPKSSYAISKTGGEYYCRLFASSLGLSTFSTRLF